MKKSLKITLAVLALAVIIAAYLINMPVSTSKDDVVKVGVIFPLSGPVAEEGNSGLTALKLAEKDISESNSLPKGKRIELLVEDGKYTAKDTIAAYHKLRLAGASAFIVYGDVPSSSLAKLVDTDKVPLIASGAGADNLPKLSPWIFRGMYSTEAVSGNLASFAFTNLEARRAAILTIRNNYGEEFARGIDEHFSKAGETTTYKETYELLDGNCRSQVAKIISEKPDAVFVLGFGPGYISCMNQLLETNYSGPVLTEHLVSIPRNYNGIYEKGKGVYLNSTVYSPYSDEEYTKKFVNEFQAETGKLPYLTEALSYLSLDLLSNAIAAKGSQPEQIREGLATMGKQKTLIGTIELDKTGECNVPLVVKRMLADGKTEIVTP